MSKLLIWDLDGTLIHCFGSGRAALEATYRDLYGVENALEGIQLAGAVDLAVIKAINSAHNINTFDAAQFFAYYSQRLSESIKTGKGISVLGGIDAVLEQLQQPGLYHVVGTGNCKAGAHVKLSLSGLDHYFEEGAYGDEVMDRKALLDLAKKRAEAAFKLSFSSEDVLVVGDTPQDIQAARLNEFVAVATTTGYYSERDLAVHEPDYIIDHFSELLGILENLWPKGYWK